MGEILSAVGDLLVGQALGEECQHLQLAVGERLDQARLAERRRRVSRREGGQEAGDEVGGGLLPVRRVGAAGPPSAAPGRRKPGLPRPARPGRRPAQERPRRRSVRAGRRGAGTAMPMPRSGSGYYEWLVRPHAAGPTGVRLPPGWPAFLGRKNFDQREAGDVEKRHGRRADVPAGLRRPAGRSSSFRLWRTPVADQPASKRRLWGFPFSNTLTNNDNPCSAKKGRSYLSMSIVWTSFYVMT